MSEVSGEENVSREPPATPPAPQATAEVQHPPPPPPGMPVQPYLMAVLPFTVFAFVLIVRALPLKAKHLHSKPISCDACMSFWGALAVGLALSWFASAHWSWSLLHLLPAPGGAALLLALHRWLTAPRELPLPPLSAPDDLPRRRK